METKAAVLAHVPTDQPGCEHRQQPTLMRIESVEALRATATVWDDLWRRSDVATPLARAELVAQWLEQFSDGRPFLALAAEQDERLVAALPLIESRVGGIVRAGRTPCGPWSSSGELLLDPACDTRAALDCLVSGLTDLAWPVVWLMGVRLDTSRWRAFQEAMRRHRHAVHSIHEFDVGQIAVDRPWQDFFEGLSKGRRRSLRRAERRLASEGKWRLRVLHDIDPPDVDVELARAFAVEDRGWKGAAGTSVVRAPGMGDFFRRQARQLAAWGQLELVLLELDGGAIAFEYGYRAKGVYFSHKVGYDREYGPVGPGQLLMRYQLEQYHADPDLRLVDCLGILDDATRRWTTHSQPIGRLVAATGGLAGRMPLRGYAAARPWIGRLRGRNDKNHE